MKTKPLLLNGKPFTGVSLRPTLERLIQFLDALPDNELLDVAGVCERSGLGHCAVRDHAKHVRLKPYVHMISGRQKSILGNPRAIKRFIQELEKDAQ